MEQTINSFLMSPVESFVSGTLSNKKGVIASETHTNNSLTWFSKTPWIKVQSNAVKVVGNDNVDDTLRKNWVLMGGALFLDSKGKQQIRGSFNSAYETKNYRPMPGIESLNVSIKGNIGLMREAKLKFKCYNLDQLEIMQTLYMTPGIGILIEWGWSKPNSTLQSIDLFTIVENDKTTGRWLSKEIKKRVSIGRGYYDAMYGIISNFNISTLEDGTFDCEVTALAPSAFTVDLNFNTPSNKIGEKLVQFFEKELSDTNTLGNLRKYAVFENIKEDITIQLVSADEQLKKDQEKKVSPDNKSDEKNDKQKATISSTNLYITWQFFEDTVNKFFALRKNNNNNDNNAPEYDDFVINSQRGKIFDGKDWVWDKDKSPRIYVSNFRFIPEGKRPSNEVKWADLWRSFYPAEVLIPGHPFDFEVVKNLSKKYPTPKQFAYPFDDMKNDWLGDLRAVYLNWNVLVKGAILNSDTIVQCINTLLSKLNDASGGIWNLELSYAGGNFTYFRVIDMNCAETTDSIKELDIFEFKAYAKDSIAKEVNVSFTLPNALKTTVMNQANGPQFDQDVDDLDKTGAFSQFNGGIADAFAVKRQRKQQNIGAKAGPSDPSKTLQNAQQSLLVKQLTISPNTIEQDAARKSLISGLKKKYWQELTADEKSVCLKIIFNTRDRQAIKVGDIGYNRTILIPAEVSVTLEGIAGFAWGNMFRVSYLPKRYLSRALFTIKDISHTVTDATWDTTIVGMMRVVPSIDRYDATKNIPDAGIHAVIGEPPLIDNEPTKEYTEPSRPGSDISIYAGSKSGGVAGQR